MLNEQTNQYRILRESAWREGLGGVGRGPKGQSGQGSGGKTFPPWRRGEGTVPSQDLGPPDASSLGISGKMGCLGKAPSLATSSSPLLCSLEDLVIEEGQWNVL